jgi:hypothetical protein
MDIVLYLFLFVFSLFLFIIGFFNIFLKRDNDKFLFSLISGIFFLILMIQSLNIELITYDSNLGTWVVYQMAANGYEYLFPMGISFIMSAISFINCFTLLPSIWNRNFKNSDLKGF